MGQLGRLLLRRVTQAVVTALLVSTVCFAALQLLPGDLALQAAAARYGEDRLTTADIDVLRQASGFDRPVAVQYARWLGRLAAGDFGRSLLTGRPALAMLAPRLSVTGTVGGTAAVLALLLAVPLGVAAGLSAGGWLDRGVAALAALTASTPTFVVGTLLVSLLAVRLQWLPAAGAGSTAHLVLPAATLALALLPGLTQVVRHGVASAAHAPYTAFALMRGVSRWATALHVAGRPACLPVVAYLPVLAMHLIEGFVTVELVFNLDGVGVLLVRSVLGRDLPVVMAAAIAFVLLVAVANAAADMLLRLLDPRPTPAMA